MANHTLRTLVLASTSPFRRELLHRLGIEFETLAPDVDEARGVDESAEALVVRLSEAKARAGAAQYPDALIIGSDQVALCEGEVLGKPGNHENACRQLARLAGRQVSFMTAICSANSRITVQAVSSRKGSVSACSNRCRARIRTR